MAMANLLCDVTRVEHIPSRPYTEIWYSAEQRQWRFIAKAISKWKSVSGKTLLTLRDTRRRQKYWYIFFIGQLY